MLDLGVCLPAGSTKQLLTLTNTAEVPMEFAWQFGVFEEQQAVISGRLSVVPTSGETAGWAVMTTTSAACAFTCQVCMP